MTRVTGRPQLQRNTWSCGAHALRHALLVYAQRVSVSRIVLLSGEAKPRERGLDEYRLLGAAERLGYYLDHRELYTDGLAREALRNYARAKVPVLLPVDRDRAGPWQHWITVLTCDRQHVFVADSQRLRVDGRRYARPVERVTWRAFLGRACVYHPGETRFDLYPLTVKGE